MKKYICTALLACLYAACGTQNSYECLSDNDCPAAVLCVAGQCIGTDATDDSGNDTSEDTDPGDTNLEDTDPEDTDPGDTDPGDTETDAPGDPDPDVIEDTIGPDADPEDVIEPDAIESYCGDGIEDDDEECDEGTANDDIADTCRTDCTLPRCGDSIVDSGEACDDFVGDQPFGWHCDVNDCRVILDTPCLGCNDASQCPGVGDGPESTSCHNGYCSLPCGPQGQCELPGTECTDFNGDNGFCELVDGDVCAVEICAVAGDEDFNGLADCDDRVCASHPSCQESDCQNDPYEPNNIFDNADGVPLNSQFIDATICGLESDFYAIEFGTHRGNITFSLQFPADRPDTDLDVNLYGIDGEVTPQQFLGGEFFTISTADFADQRVTLEVHNYDRRAYSVPYRLAFYPENTDCGADWYEPNDDESQAYPLWNNYAVSATVCQDDVDQFRLGSLPSGSDGVLSLEAINAVRLNISSAGTVIYSYVGTSDLVGLAPGATDEYIISVQSVDRISGAVDYELEATY